MSEGALSTRRVTRWRGGECRVLDDDLVVEEPLEIRVNDAPFTVMEEGVRRYIVDYLATPDPYL